MKLTIRMYCQGLGDCFLLKFESEAGQNPFNMLVDFGLFLHTKGETIRLKEVADNINLETGGILDLVLGTHEHYDHLSGFAHQESWDVLDNMKIRNLWLSWCEDEKSELATKLKTSTRIQSKALFDALGKASADKEKLGLDNNNMDQLAKIQGVLDFQALGQEMGVEGEKVPATTKAIQNLKGKAESREYQIPGNVRTFAELPDIRFYILGPPQSELITKSDPFGAVPQTFSLKRDDVTGALRMESDSSSEYSSNASQDDLPFEESVGIPMSEADKSSAFYKRYYVNADANNSSKTIQEYNEARNIDYDWISSAEALALGLDDYVNNTSLAIAIEHIPSGKVFLFPGDAQVGNWLSWHELSWKVTDAQGKVQIINAEHLLNNTVFYKVGHHGSHNATLKTKGLDMMTHPELSAMIPVNEEFAHGQGGKNPWQMPFHSMYATLKEHTQNRIRRADNIDSAQVSGLGNVSFVSGGSFSAGADTPMYFDYIINL